MAAPPFDAARCARAITDARAFFALTPREKSRLAIERSPHFRGTSALKNERDWREQAHFGRERAAGRGKAAYVRLHGPNLWPDDPPWRERLLALMRDLEGAGRQVLDALTVQLGLRASSLLAPGEEPYILLKLIHYLPPPSGPGRSGVAAHVDFSWITLVIQDDTPGLEVRDREGRWREVPYAPGALLVTPGEVLQLATGGRVPATPHRVVSRDAVRSRVSLPFFLCPDLATRVRVPSGYRPPDDADHVHRVAVAPGKSFVFGEVEWRRKALGRWCATCVGPAFGS